MVVDMGYWSKVLKRIFILFLSIVGFYILIKCSIFYMPFVIAFIIAMLIEPLVKRVHKKSKLSRKTSAIIVLIIVSAILIGIITWGVITLVSESYNFLGKINEYSEKIYNQCQWIMDKFKFERIHIPEQITSIMQNSTQDVIGNVSKMLSNFLNVFIQWLTSLPTIGIYIAVTLMATYFICVDKLYMVDQVEHHFPKTWVKRVFLHIRELISSLGSYLKAEFILVAMAFVEVLVGLYILKWIGLDVQYPFLTALGIGFIDALPILGSGTAMVPWAVIEAINGNIKLAIGILVILVVISIVRQFLEPKIVSKQIGIHPIFTLIAMYTGFKIIGVLGLLIGPIALIVIKNVYGTLIDKGVVKTIFDRK